MIRIKDVRKAFRVVRIHSIVMDWRYKDWARKFASGESASSGATARQFRAERSISRRLFLIRLLSRFNSSLCEAAERSCNIDARDAFSSFFASWQRFRSVVHRRLYRHQPPCRSIPSPPWHRRLRLTIEKHCKIIDNQGLMNMLAPRTGHLRVMPVSTDLSVVG